MRRLIPPTTGPAGTLRPLVAGKCLVPDHFADAQRRAGRTGIAEPRQRGGIGNPGLTNSSRGSARNQASDQPAPCGCHPPRRGTSCPFGAPDPGRYSIRQPPAASPAPNPGTSACGTTPTAPTAIVTCCTAISALIAHPEPNMIKFPPSTAAPSCRSIQYRFSIVPDQISMLAGILGLLAQRRIRS